MDYQYALFAPGTIGLAITDEVKSAAGIIGLTYELPKRTDGLRLGKSGESPAAWGTVTFRCGEGLNARCKVTAVVEYSDSAAKKFDVG